MHAGSSPIFKRVYGQSCIERYMRVVNVAERLVVCLSEYLPLRSVCILVIKVQGFVL